MPVLLGGLVGGLNRRYSSFLIRNLLIFSLLFAGPFASAPGFAAETASAERALTDVRLPPALEAFLILLLYACPLDRTTAINPAHYESPSESDRLLVFKTGLSGLIKTYGDIKPYEGPRINTLEEYVKLVEPTRVSTGSARGDALALNELFKNGDLAPAVRVNLSDFANLKVQNEAQLFEYYRTQKLKAFIGQATGNGTLQPTVMASVIKGIMGMFFTTSGVIAGLRAISQESETEKEKTSPAAPTEPSPASKDPKAKKGVAEPVVTSPKPPSDGQVTDLARSFGMTLTGVRTFAGATAGVIEGYQSLGADESSIVEILRRLSELNVPGQIEFLDRATQNISNNVLSAIFEIGDRLAASSEVGSVSDEKTRKLLSVFFSSYLPKLESDTLLNILLDIMRAPVDTQDHQLAGIALLHYDPIVHQYLQTLEGIGNVSSGPLGRIFHALREDNLKLPYSVVKSVLDSDVNQYPLRNFEKDPFKAGKLFQVHRAEWHEGNNEPIKVVARVLKPGAQPRLEVALRRLKGMAAQISDALKNARGGGPSIRRIEQLLEIIYRNLKTEIIVSKTVENQLRGARRLSGRVEVTTRSGKRITVELRVPKAFPAAAGSKVMVMEEVAKGISLSEMHLYHADALEAIGAVLWKKSAENILVGPMEATLKKLEVKDGEENFSEIFTHADMHSGNFKFLPPIEEEGGRTVYPVTIFDYGLVVSSDNPDDLRSIALLVVGASYSSAPFIQEALWRLRDPLMKQMDEKDAEERWQKLCKFVNQKVRELRGQTLLVGDWARLVWEQEILDFPDWVVLLEQSQRAVTSSFFQLGNDDDSLKRIEADLAKKYRKLFLQYLGPLTKRHKGWRTIYYQEALLKLGQMGNCLSYLTYWFKPRSRRPD